MFELPIARPPWTGLGKRLESMVRKALYDYKMVENVTHVAIALSGGKDSLALLFLLHAIKGRGFNDFKITAIHVSGEFTCGAGVNLNFLKAICKELDVELIVKTSFQKLETLECYSCSRERRRLLFNAMKECGATTIAFGHHRDDNAETILMNLLGKAEFCGNLPKIDMVEYGVTIIRPLIFISEKQIIEFSQKYGFKRITCQCPVGQDSMRKHVKKLIETIEKLYPNAGENIANAGLRYGSTKALRP